MDSGRDTLGGANDGPQTSKGVREKQVQEIAWEKVDDVRNRELALARRERRRPQSDYDDALMQRDDKPERSRENGRNADPRSTNDGEYERRDSRRHDGRRDDRAYHDNDRNNPGPRQRGHKHRRVGSDSPNSSSQQQPSVRRDRKPSDRLQTNASDIKKTMKTSCQGTFGNFDRSGDGFITAAAGAAMGAITAREFGGPENKGLKAFGAAIAGGLLFNAVENKVKRFSEVREEVNEEKEMGNGRNEGRQRQQEGQRRR